MNRYLISSSFYYKRPGGEWRNPPRSPIEEMRVCLHEDYAPYRRQGLFQWLDDALIPYHVSVDIRSHPAPMDHGFEQTLQTTILCLENAEDAVWLRLKYGFLPLPDDFDFYTISADSEQIDQRYWII